MFFENNTATYLGDHAQKRFFLYISILNVMCKLSQDNLLSTTQFTEVLSRLLQDEENELRGESRSAITDSLNGYIASPARLLSVMQRNPERFNCWKRLDLTSEVTQCKTYVEAELLIWLNGQFAHNVPLLVQLKHGAQQVHADLENVVDALKQFQRDVYPALT